MSEPYKPVTDFADDDFDRSSLPIRDFPAGKPRYKLSIFPDQLDFRTVEDGQASDPQIVVLINAGYDDLIINAVRVVGEFSIIGVVPQLIMVGESASLQITYNPTSTGDGTGGVFIDTGDAAGEEFIKLIGTGDNTFIPGTNLVFLKANNTDLGTSSIIQATTPTPVPAGDAAVMIVLNITRENSTSPVQVRFNNDPTLTIKNNDGIDIAPHYLQENMILVGYKFNGTFRILTDNNAAQLSTIFLSEQARDEAHSWATSSNASAIAAQTSADNALVEANIATAKAALAAAWSEGTLPGGAGTKSAKEWALSGGMPDGSVTFAKLYADVAVRLIEFDVRDSRFAGGAKLNDIDDDTPAFQAAYAYFATLGGLNQYTGKNGAKLNIPRGVSRVTNLDATGGTNVRLAGQGNGQTTLRSVGNNPCIFTTNVAGTSDGYRIAFEGFTIYGPGRALGNAHGLKLGSINNGLIRDINIYACRHALDVYNHWQTEVLNFKADGGTVQGSSLACYNGIYMRDGPGSVLENCLKITGGVISGVENYSFRGESISGTVIVGMEFLAAGKLAMYLGDNPTGKDVKWFTVVGCLFDTTPDLIKINRGGAAYCGQMHFEGCWDGYASEGGGNGVILELNNVEDAHFGFNTALNSDIGLVANGCNNISFRADILSTYDRSHVGAVPLQLNSTGNSVIKVGAMSKDPGSIGTIAASEIGSSDFNMFDLPMNDGTVNIVGANTMVRLGTKSKRSNNRGGANIAVGTTSIVVNHGLFRTPGDGEVTLTQKFNQTAVGVSDVWVDTFTATTFTIRSNAAPSSTLGVYWSADVSRC